MALHNLAVEWMKQEFRGYSEKPKPDKSNLIAEPVNDVVAPQFSKFSGQVFARFLPVAPKQGEKTIGSVFDQLKSPVVLLMGGPVMSQCPPVMPSSGSAQPTRARGPKNCPHCGKSFRHNKSLRQHCRTYHQDLRLLVPMTTTSVPMMPVRPAAPVNCSYCTHTFSDMNSLKQHLEQVHGARHTAPQTVERKLDDEKDARQDEAVDVVDTDTAETRDKSTHRVFHYACSICSVVFKHRPSLAHHQRKFHSNPISSEVSIQHTAGPHLVTPEDSSSARANATEPISAVASTSVKRPRFSCELCFKLFAAESNLKTHRRLMHRSQVLHQASSVKSRVLNRRSMKCPVESCSYEYGNMKLVISHLNNFHNENIVPETHTFSNRNEFDEWKRTVEEITSSRFRKKLLRGSGGVGKSRRCIYLCTGQVCSSKRDRKRLKSNDLQRKCPAHFTVRITDAGEFNVAYFSKHFCHQNSVKEFGDVNISQTDKKCLEDGQRENLKGEEAKAATNVEVTRKSALDLCTDLMRLIKTVQTNNELKCIVECLKTITPPVEAVSACKPSSLKPINRTLSRRPVKTSSSLRWYMSMKKRALAVRNGQPVVKPGCSVSNEIGSLDAQQIPTNLPQENSSAQLVESVTMSCTTSSPAIPSNSSAPSAIPLESVTVLFSSPNAYLMTE